MIQWFTKKLNNNKGFTLIELLIVLAVMALIATIAFPSFTGLMDGFRHKADVQTANAVARQMQARILTDVGSITTGSNYQTITTTNFGESLPDIKTDGTETWQYRLSESSNVYTLDVQIVFSGTNAPETIQAAQLSFTDID